MTIPAPVISRLDPDSGLVDANVTIEGSNFGSQTGTVTFNGTTASTTSWDSDEIQTKVPSGATTGPVVVTTAGGKSSAGVSFTVTLPAPVISRLDPNSGLVNSSVTIEGSNFGSRTGSVTFNGTTASTTSWDSEEIQTKVPSGATTGLVVVTTSGGQSSAGVTFTVIIPAPVISRLDPDSGPVDAEVRIHGSNFGATTGTVTFNGVTASPNQWNDQTIRVRVPDGATDGPVVVTTAGGQSSTGVTFTVTDPPSGPIISKLEPDSGLVGTKVKITGSNFGTSSGTVTFNGTTASTTSWDSDEIQTKVPEGATSGLVVVTVDGEPSAGVTFTVTLPAPVISRLDPNSGLVDANVTIEGSNFGSQTGSVTFNGTTASTTSWDSDEIQTKVPDGATSGPVVVRTSGGQSSAGVTFTVTIPAPVISRLDPDSGPVDTEVRIHGSNFGDRTGSVTFNGVTASPNQWNDQTIRVRVPDGATTGPVVVTTAGGQSSAGVTFTVTEPEPEPEDPSPEDPSDFSSSDLTGTSFTLNGTRLDGSAERVTVLFREGNRFEAAGSRTGSYDYRPTGPSAGTLTLEYDGGGSCEVELAFDSVNSGASSFECSTGGGGSGRFRLTAGTTFVPVILTAAGRNDSFFTSEMTLTNRGTREARLHYTYTAHIGRGNRLHLRGASGGASAGGVGCARPPQEPGNPHSRRGEPHRDAEGGGSGRLPGGRAGPDHHGRPRRARRPGLPRYRDGGGIPAGRLPVRTAPEHTGPFQRGLSEHGRPGRRSHHLEDNRILRRPQRPGAPGPAGGKAGTGRIPPVFGSVGQPRQRLREGGASRGEPRPFTPMASSTTRPTPTAPTSSRSWRAFPGGPRDRPCR